jgi:hypothetical protein
MSIMNSPSTSGEQETRIRVFLPNDIIWGTWESLIKKWGLQLTGVKEGNLLEVDLPSGWSLAPQADDNNRRLLTDGRERKRAVYCTDSSDLVLYDRYDVVLQNVPSQFPFRKIHWYEVIDADGRTLFKTEELADPSLEATHLAREVFEDTRRELAEAAHNWLNTHFPPQEDRTAYWD